MSWDLDWALNETRAERLAELGGADTRDVRWDGIGDHYGLGVDPPRNVLARAHFRGRPGREDDAARAWAMELKNYFKRGVGEPPVVTYASGVYQVTGLIQTTHPGDRPNAEGIVIFT